MKSKIIKTVLLLLGIMLVVASCELPDVDKDGAKPSNILRQFDED